MAKSKSKTFPKGTDKQVLTKWITEQIHTRLVDGPHYAYDEIQSKYLITITKLPEKGEKEG